MSSLILYRELIRNLVLKDLKLKYRDSVLGFLWSLANPLLLIAVYSFVFGHILRGGPENFAYFLMVGILPWNFFSQSLMMSTGSILDNGNLIRKVSIPMEVFPVATVLFNLAQYLLALAVFFPMALLFFKVSPALAWITFLPILALQIIFILGLSFILSTATVFYRDVRHFTEIFLLLLFWLTPIIYDIRTLPEPLRQTVRMNPLSFFIAAYQDIFYRRMFPDSSVFLALVFLSSLSLMGGYGLFARCKAQFPEEV